MRLSILICIIALAADVFLYVDILIVAHANQLKDDGEDTNQKIL